MKKDAVILRIVASLTLCLAGFAVAKDKTVTTTVTRVKSANTPLYKTEASEGEDKVADLGGGDEVTILKQGKSRSLVKTSGNVKGWVENNGIERVKITSGGAHNLKDVEVVGWLDNPSAVYILDNTNPDLNALPIDRNFDKEIIEKKDREEVERSYDEN